MAEPVSGSPIYMSLEDYQRKMPQWSKTEHRRFRLEDPFRQDKDNRRAMVRLIESSGESVLGDPVVRLYEADGMAIVAFNYGRIDIHFVAMSSNNFYDEAGGPLPEGIDNKLQEWSDNPDLLVQLVRQRVAQLP